MAKFHSPTAQEIMVAAKTRALVHLKDDDRDVPRCDPDGAWHADRNMRGWLNPANSKESEIVTREAPLAYKVYVDAYLREQGWRR